jgi:DNA-directed RNA polymerase subunit D
LERFNMPSECVCGGEGCPSCQVSFRLNVEGPKVVYSGYFASDDPEIKPVFDNIPVVELYKGQQLMIEAVARLGVGREHAKFQPVSVCAYRIIPEVRINEGCTNCKECIESCPKKILAESEGKIKVVNANVCSMCMECVKVCIENAISIKETDSFLFTVEGVGSLPIRTVMKKALELLAKKAEEMSKILEAIVV